MEQYQQPMEASSEDFDMDQQPMEQPQQPLESPLEECNWDPSLESPLGECNWDPSLDSFMGEFLLDQPLLEDQPLIDSFLFNDYPLNYLLDSPNQQLQSPVDDVKFYPKLAFQIQKPHDTNNHIQKRRPGNVFSQNE